MDYDECIETLRKCQDCTKTCAVHGDRTDAIKALWGRQDDMNIKVNKTIGSVAVLLLLIGYLVWIGYSGNTKAVEAYNIADKNRDKIEDLNNWAPSKDSALSILQTDFQVFKAQTETKFDAIGEKIDDLATQQKTSHNEIMTALRHRGEGHEGSSQHRP